MHFGDLAAGWRWRRQPRPAAPPGRVSARRPSVIGGAGRRSRSARVLVVLVVVLAFASATTACGGPADEDEPTTATGRFAQIHTGVCAAAQFSAAGDDARAEEAFDDAHFGLHALVQAVEQEDRAAAARLLEAIEKVESTGSTASLEALTAEVAESIERTGGTAPDTCA